MIRVLICSSVFLCLASAQGYAGEHFPFPGEASKDAVHVRAGANSNFESVAKLSKGQQVMVTGRNYEWYKVRLPADAGAYIRADYVNIMDGTVGTVVADKVNIRARANSDSSSLGQLNTGDTVKLMGKLILPAGQEGPTDGQVNGWWRIEPPASAEGWVRADLIAEKAAAAQPTAKDP